MDTRPVPRRRSPLWIEVLIVVACVSMWAHSRMRLTGSNQQTSSEGMALLTAADEGPGAEWVGIYLDNQKIGAGLADTRATPDGFRIQERTFLKLRAFEQDKEVTTVMVADTDQQHRLRSFSFLLSAPPAQIDVRGIVARTGADYLLQLDVRTGGEVQQQTLTLKELPELSLTYKDRILARNPRKGDRIEVPYFDPTTLSQQKMAIQVVDEGTATVDGKTVSTLTLAAGYQGVQTQQVVTRDGRILEETNTLGMKLKRESRQAALTEGWNGRELPVDIIALSAVPLETPIDKARETRYLRAKLKGGGVEVLLARGEGENPGEVINRVLNPDVWEGYNIPWSGQRFQRELESTTLIQSREPLIRQTAQSIIGDSLRVEDAAKKLSSWVHDNLKKAPVMGIPSALDILRTREGDCNEHTTLFTALARSVGIPTRMAAGVVYSEAVGGGPAFYYHAWPEIYMGEWIPIDPTFGQFPADATHIRLVEGDLADQLSLVRVVGNLEIEVLETR